MAKDDDALAATVAGATGELAVTSGVLGSRAPSSLTERLAGRYEVLGLLGVGGMGSVYRARDIELDEIVALKVLAEGTDASFLDRFRQEVKLARRVTHRNVARTYDIGEHGTMRFLTMELVEGEALAKLLERERRLPVGRTLLLARELCHGLAAAHAANVIHRDLKPENVLLGRDGRVVITDFGIARAMADAPSRTQGMILGTPAYMAPEQVEGAAVIDARADIYALGAILYELVTGHRAWEGESPIAVATARVLRPPPDPRLLRPDLPQGVADVILRCMQRKPDARFHDVHELELAIDQLLATTVAETGAYPAPKAIGSSSPALSHAPSDVRIASPSGLVGTPHAEKTLAVLPFRNGGPPEDEYLAEGLTEDLIDGLSMLPDLRVRSRGAVMHLRGKTGDPRDLGRDLDVRVVVDGSVRRAGSSVRVSVRLVSVADGFQLWAKRFERPAGDVLLIADEAAEAIAAALTVEHKQRASPAQDPEVVDLYLRARHEYHLHWAGGNARAVELFAQAAGRAPQDARVLGGYALALMRRFNLDQIIHEDAASAAREMAARALAIEPNAAEPRVVNAAVAWGFGDGPTAAREVLAAYRGNPGLPEAHEYYGRLLLEAGRIEEAIARLQVAVTMEPEMHTVRSEIVRAYALLGDRPKLDAAMGPPPKEPSFLNLYWLSKVRFTMWWRDQDAMFRAAEEMMQGPAFEMRPVALGACQMYRRRQRPASLLDFFNMRASADAQSARRRAFAAQLHAEIAMLYDEPDEALNGIERAVNSALMDVAWLDHCPLFETLRKEPRFLAAHAIVKARADAVLAILPTL